MTVNEIPNGPNSYVEMNDGGYGVITIASGTFTVAACSKKSDPMTSSESLKMARSRP